MSDVYTPYETGLQRLLEQLDRDPPRRDEVLIYRQRLGENIAQSRQYGDTETRRAERSEVLSQLDQVSQSVLGLAFLDLCGSAEARPGKRLLLLWGAQPFPLLERPPAKRAILLRQQLAEAAGLAPAERVPLWPALPILSLDPSDRVERAFAEAHIPLQVVSGRQDLPVRGRHNLFKLAGDLSSRRGVIFSRAELRNLHDDPDKRYLLEEALRGTSGGTLLLLGCDPADRDFQAWWAVLAPRFGGLERLALGDPAAPWSATNQTSLPRSQQFPG